MDGSTDAGNVEDEVLVIISIYSARDKAITQEIRSCTRFFPVEVPMKADANGLLNFLSRRLLV